MHQEFKDRIERLGLSLYEIEKKIGCSKNYLSQFINGTRDLPKKWEKPIADFIAGVKRAVDKIEEKPANPYVLMPWIKSIEDYCKMIGKDPEGLIEDHKALAGFKRITEAAIGSGKVQIQDLNANPAKGNYAINTHSDWMAEQRKKKCGF